MGLNSDLFKVIDKIPQSSRLSINKAAIKHADRIEVGVHFHHSSSEDGVSGSKFKTLPLDVTEEEFNNELILLERDVFEYFLKTYDN